MQPVESLLLKAQTEFSDPERPLKPGATAAVIEAFQRLVGTALPDSLLELYARCDGEALAHGEDSPRMFYGLKFWSLEQATFMLSIFRENAEADLNWKMQSLPPGMVRELYLSRMWIPFAGIGSTDYFALDYDPGPKGVAGQVILFSTDEARRTCVAKSFDHFLGTMLKHYAARMYHPVFDWTIDDLYAVPFDAA